MLKLSHVRALLIKEVRQILSDKSVLIVAFIIPLLLVVLYGSGLRMDIKPVNVALVSSSLNDQITRELAFALSGSDYFELTTVNNEIEAKQLMAEHKINAYISLPSNLAQSAYHIPVSVMITINGVDAQQASLSRSYIESVIMSVLQNKNLTRQFQYLKTVNSEDIARSGNYSAASFKEVTVTSRNWFNESNNSTWYLMAGQLIGVLTLMSAFMSSIVIAREFERGTMLGVLATNVTAVELLISKILPYYVLSLLGGGFAILTALILYDLPFRGSAGFYILTMMVYMYVTVLLGLLISAVTQNQFLSSEYAIILSFLPSILLSGALFDLRSIPSFINNIAHLFPPTYAVSSSKICLLSGGSYDELLKNLLILLLFAVIFTALCYMVLSRHFKRYLPHNVEKSLGLNTSKGSPTSSSNSDEAALKASSTPAHNTHSNTAGDNAD